jgi:hypothetical protein
MLSDRMGVLYATITLIGTIVDNLASMMAARIWCERMGCKRQVAYYPGN